jgi:hypothetical protein
MMDDSTRTTSGAVEKKCKVDGFFPRYYTY